MADLIHRHYNVFGTSVRLSFNSENWMKSMERYLLLPPGVEGQAEIDLVLLEVPASEVDAHIPLPGPAHEEKDGVLLVNRPVPYRAYATQQARWVDYAAYARTWVDYRAGSGVAVKIKDSGVTPLFSDILLGYNVLVGMLLKAGFCTIHGSCVNVYGRGVVFTGDSGKGKSTAAYALLRKGHPILVDDRLQLVKRDDRYLGVTITDVIKLRTEAIKGFFPELQERVPFLRLEDESYYKVSETGLNYLVSTNIDCVMALQRTGQPESYVEKINPVRVVGDLFPVTLTGCPAETMAQKFEFLMDFLAAVDCFRVSFGTDMDAFTTVVEELARR